MSTRSVKHNVKHNVNNKQILPGSIIIHNGIPMYVQSAQDESKYTKIKINKKELYVSELPAPVSLGSSALKTNT
jgi:hypothetical protein